MGKAVQLDHGNWATEVLGHPGTVVVDVYAEWCGPCRVMAPVIDRLAAAGGKVKYAKMDLENNHALCRELGISVLPTLLFYKDGKLVKTETGIVKEDVLARTASSL